MASLKEIRTARGISQEHLAELVGVSRQTISRWESGIVQPSADRLIRLSEVFQLPVEAFLRDDWKPPEQQAVEAVQYFQRSRRNPMPSLRQCPKSRRRKNPVPRSRRPAAGITAFGPRWPRLSRLSA